MSQRASYPTAFCPLNAPLLVMVIPMSEPELVEDIVCVSWQGLSRDAGVKRRCGRFSPDVESGVAMMAKPRLAVVAIFVKMRL